MTTQEALTHLMEKRSWYKLAGITQTQASSVKFNLPRGLVAEDYQIKLLRNAGYHEIPVQWDPPKDLK